MFNPQYRILLTSKCFPEDEVVGLGTQLISIVNSIKHYLVPHLWYGADIESIQKIPTKHDLNNIQLSVIGTDLQFIQYCSEIEQFIWGVFLCVDKNFSSQNIEGIELETEDKSFRSISAKGILIEIRAFDTTYFGIYTDNIELITKISEMYHIEFEKVSNPASDKVEGVE